MGNQVLIAIRHDIDRDAIPEFEENFRLGIHEPERIPKSYDRNGSLLMSHYHHASDGICLMVNNQVMVNIPSYLNLFRNAQAQNDVDALSIMLNNYRQYRYSSVRKSTKKTVAVPNDGVKVSLFGYLTDRTSDMPNDAFKRMVDAIDTMPALVNDTTAVRGYDAHIGRTPIVMLGTIDASQMALVELYGNLFSVVAKPCAKIDTLADCDARADSIIDFDTKFLKALGYTIKVSDKNRLHMF